MTGKKSRAGLLMLRAAKWAGLTSMGAALAFLLSAWAGSSIPRNPNWTEPDDGVEIMLASNGIHTEIIMPLANDVIDWRGVFPLRDIHAASRPYTHVSVSWGERAFFLETPTWADVSPATVISAMTGGDGVVHVAWYVRPAPDPHVRPLRVSRENYEALVTEIKAQLALPEARKAYRGYAAHDVFYDAIGTYHVGNTCNQWTSDRLAASGIKTGQWTPMAGGVMKWVPALEQR